MFKLLAPRFKAIIHNYAFGGLSGEDLSEQSRRILLINLFCLVGVLFTLPHGILAFIDGDMMIAASTLSIASLYTFNHIYLRLTFNYEVSSNIILYPLFMLMFFLLYSGGVAQTGFVWIYCIAPVAMFLHGLKRGLIEITFFLIILILIFLFPNEIGATYNWSAELKKRIVYSFLVLGFLSAFYEYSRMKSIHLLRNISKDLEKASKTDPLTNLLNRRGMLEIIRDNNASKKIFDNAIVICDVDFFKKVNDQYGHNVGDEVLIKLSNEFKETWGKDAHISRWGGEEFLIFIPSSLFDIIQPEVERFRKRIESIRFGALDNPFHITLSFGIARFDYQKETVDAAINRADKHLYKAKNHGRNCIFSD
ncbi:GGDEF domain-containing protein [Marinomonas sp. 15G1-11]|uniref:diguanylate cyclase n=1 Tax=Marinomonas phaeophyticola TaxID=3004091 RepID=A0ABT4JU56_9GAMM|nr:GGDEF domain-containing protein [Marinomonas sp. 15G1-11]MCZ2721751.1 GGDEF domain-containing protein [Marinomonas sp. 15G1-11]